MTPQDTLLEVFCLVDDQLQALDLPPLRSRGPQPTLADSEVITMELVGELWKLDTDKDLFRFFRLYHRREFPALARVNRTTFTRQAANLWRVKQLIQQRLAAALSEGDPVWLVDSLPVDACQFARATFCRRFAGQADYGYCHLRKRTFYGFRLHLRVNRDGVILGFQLAPARASEKAVLPELGLPADSVGIGDRNYWSPDLRQRLAAAGVTLLAPYYQKSKDPDPRRSARLSAVRYKIETVNGQLAERYNIKRTWAKDLWHLCHRIIRKILSHTVAIVLTARAGHQPLQFDAWAA
jgi:Transposase DDE domain